MRVIAGKYKGRRLVSPSGHRTHPMGDRIKTALFNTIISDVAEARVLDAYAGSGALAIEALSRGAVFAQVIDSDKKAIRAITDNFQSAGVPAKDYKITQANCSSWSERNVDAQFELIFVDPPFDALNLSTVSQLVKHLTPNGLMVLSHVGREAVPTVKGVVVVDNRMYGDAALSYYRKAASTNEGT